MRPLISLEGHTLFRELFFFGLVFIYSDITRPSAGLMDEVFDDESHTVMKTLK